MSSHVMVITAREVYRYKMAYHGDKFLHTGAVTIVNNRVHQAVIEHANNHDRSWITVTYLSGSMTHRLITTMACYGYRNTT